jgi:hypothetical protein
MVTTNSFNRPNRARTSLRPNGNGYLSIDLTTQLSAAVCFPAAPYIKAQE